MNENQTKITASIVLYKEKIDDLTKTINCFLSSDIKKKLFLIDNTPAKEFANKFNLPEIEYIALGENSGFGAGHNKVLKKINEISEFHLILNPDVTFSPKTIPNLINVIGGNEEVSMIAPKVLFPDGKHQYSCRRYPRFFELLIRRIPFLKKMFKKKYNQGIYKDKDITKPIFAEYITGCFQLYKTDDLIKINGFDERYFLYMEDVDICKKIDVLGKKKLYYPNEEIVHILKQGSSKNINLFFRHTISAIKYFLKWGI
ncbi:MAG: glycosyltransferase family 2 protein [Flavobacteriaceae bacterium]|nr:glycosyltransferase family 2 protein [Flavobacteriaceae bacterium]